MLWVCVLGVCRAAQEIRLRTDSLWVDPVTCRRRRSIEDMGGLNPATNHVDRMLVGALVEGFDEDAARRGGVALMEGIAMPTRPALVRVLFVEDAAGAARHRRVALVGREHLLPLAEKEALGGAKMLWFVQVWRRWPATAYLVAICAVVNDKQVVIAGEAFHVGELARSDRPRESS